MLSSTLTHREVMGLIDLSLAGIADPDASVPVVENIAAQGDVLVRRIESIPASDFTHVPMAGVAVIGGESRSGNAHILHPLGESDFVTFARVSGDRNIEGYITVKGSASLTHTEEHGSLLLHDGQYEVRQRTEREQRVQD